MSKEIKRVGVTEILGKEIVYFIKNNITNLVKIGYTSNIVSRMESLQQSFNIVGMECKLKLINYIKCDKGIELEKYIHNKLNLFRQKGEWFNINEQQVLNICNNINTSNFNYTAEEIKKKQKSIDNASSLLTFLHNAFHINNGELYVNILKLSDYKMKLCLSYYSHLLQDLSKKSNLQYEENIFNIKAILVLLRYVGRELELTDKMTYFLFYFPLFHQMEIEQIDNCTIDYFKNFLIIE